jgi:pimeloyl-ACP methyl ester carboxylesterase
VSRGAIRAFRACPESPDGAKTGEFSNGTFGEFTSGTHNVAALGLVGCGTFDLATRAKLAETLSTRRSTGRPYDYAPLAPPYEDVLPEPFDGTAHAQTWDDMVRLQHEGCYPQTFAAIHSPVLMIHGEHDPHPGAMIRDSLKPYLPKLKYCQLKKCGHSPWIEQFARDEFFSMLKAWILLQFSNES